MSSFYIFDDFDAVSGIINESTSIINDLSSVSVTLSAFRNMYPPLIDYLTDHLAEIAEIALDLEPVKPDQYKNENVGKIENSFQENKNSQKIYRPRQLCIQILTQKNMKFVDILCNNRKFLMKLNYFISKAKENSNFSNFCQIMLNMIKMSGGLVLLNFPEKQFLLTKMLKFIKVPAIFYFFCDLALLMSKHQIVNDFLESGNFTKKIMISAFDKSPENSIELLSNVISDLPKSSILVIELLSEENLTKISNCAFNKPECTMISLELMSKLCNESSSRFFYGIGEKLSEIILKNDHFDLKKKVAADVLINSIPYFHRVPTECYNVLKKLFNMMFENPFFTILHCTCKNMFKAVCRVDKPVFNKINIREKLAHEITKLKNDEKDNTPKICVGYKIHIYKIAKYYLSSRENYFNLFESEDEEDKVIEEYYNNIRKRVKEDYGGYVPIRDAKDLSPIMKLWREHQ